MKQSNFYQEMEQCNKWYKVLSRLAKEFPEFIAYSPYDNVLFTSPGTSDIIKKRIAVTLGNYMLQENA